MRVATDTTKLLSTAAEVTAAQAQPEVFVQLALGTVPKSPRLDLPPLLLFKAKCVLASCHLLLPSLDFLLPGKCVRFENGIDKPRKLARALVHLVDATFIALDGCGGIVTIGLGFSGDGELRDLRWWFVTCDLLACTLDIQNERVVRRRDMEYRVASISRATSVEAVQAHIEASGVILYSKPGRRQNV